MEKNTLQGDLCSVLLTKYHSAYQIQNNEMGGDCGTYGGQERCIQHFGGETEGSRPLGRPRRLWEDNTKMDVKEVE